MIPCLEAIESGICRADCCGIFPFSQEFWVTYSHMAEAICRIESRMTPYGQMVLPVTEDLRCVFLDRETCRCTIYPHRPDVCRRFGIDSDVRLQCPYFNPKGYARTRAERRKFQRLMKKKIERMGKYAKRPRRALTPNERRK
jgi:Fe-S-cluster containining protein